MFTSICPILFMGFTNPNFAPKVDLLDGTPAKIRAMEQRKRIATRSAQLHKQLAQMDAEMKRSDERLQSVILTMIEDGVISMLGFEKKK